MVEVSAVIATTHPLKKYRGTALTLEALESMQTAIESGRLPMQWNHDPEIDLRAELLTATIEQASDGKHRLVATFQMTDDEWDFIDNQLREAGAPGGFSPAFTTFQATVNENAAEAISIAADAAAFSDEDRIAAATLLSNAGAIKVKRLYQLSEIEVALIVIEIMANVGGLLAMVKAATSRLIGSRDGESRLEIKRVSANGSEDLVRVTTDDPDVAVAAIDAAFGTLEDEEPPPSS